MATKLSKNEFTEIFIKPLSNKFRIKIYWSGEESKKAGLSSIQGNYSGWSFTDLKSAPIVLRFLQNQQEMLGTVIHEIAHSVLHRKGTEGYDLSNEAHEIEATTVEIRVSKLLGLSFDGAEYLKKYRDQFIKKNGYEYKMIARKPVIDNLINDIYETLKTSKEIAQGLPNDVVTVRSLQYKYMITCTCCGREYGYKKKTAVIKTQAKDAYCVDCGEESLGKLTVREIS